MINSTRIGPFEVIGEIDISEKRRILKVVHFGATKQLAMKVVNSAYREDLRRELECLVKLQEHPLVSRVFAQDVEGSSPYIVTELADYSLRTLQLPVPFPKALPLVLDILDILKYAHKNGIVHRDVKPENILVRGHRATLTDFGSAKVEGLEQLLLQSNSCDESIVGTYDYMAPEQRNGQATSKSDIFSTGVLAYELVVGKLPRMNGPLPSQHGCPKWFNEFIRIAIAPDPSDRFDADSAISFISKKGLGWQKYSSGKKDPMTKLIAAGLILSFSSLAGYMMGFFTSDLRKTLFHMRSKNDYLATYRAAESSREIFEEFILPPGMTLPIEEDIANAGYDAYKANVPSLAKASVVVLGEIHISHYGTANAKLVDRLIGPDDTVCLEVPSDQLSDYDFRPTEVVHPDAKERLEELSALREQRNASPAEEEEYRCVLINEVKHWRTTLTRNVNDLDQDRSHATKLIWSLLAKRQKGKMQGIDIPERDDGEYSKQYFRTVFLEQIKHTLTQEGMLHPFEEWLLQDDLKLTHISGLEMQMYASDVLSIVNKYVQSIPIEDINRTRQERMINNIVQVVRTTPNKRTVVIVGAAHVDGPLQPSLTDRLESEKIGYVAFCPDRKRRNLGEKDYGDHLKNVARWYVNARSKEGIPAYTDGFDTLAKHWGFGSKK